jgi:hypothetical protein
VAEYTQNASQGMAIHFNTWVGNASFGGVLDPSILPVNEYIDWVQYSSYANGAFEPQWREDFDGAGIPAGWAVGNWQSPYGLSTHNQANVTFVNGVAVLSLTADGATGYSGVPPVDTDGGSSVVPADAGATETSPSNGCGCRTSNGRLGRWNLVALALGVAGLSFRRLRRTRGRSR